MLDKTNYIKVLHTHFGQKTSVLVMACSLLFKAWLKMQHWARDVAKSDFLLAPHKQHLCFHSLLPPCVFRQVGKGRYLFSVFFFREVIRGSGWFHIQFFVEFDLFRLPLKTFFPPKTCVNVCLHIFPLNVMWKCEQMAPQMNQKRKSTHTQAKEQAHKISLCIYINITWVWMWSVMADLP